MSKRDLKILSREEKEADAAINRYADESGILKCVGFRKGVFTYVDMSVSTGKFRLTSQPEAAFDLTATDVKLKYSMSSLRTSVTIRVVTHLNEVDHFSKPAFEHHWTLEEWYSTYPATWQTIQAKWPRPCPERIARSGQDHIRKGGKIVSSDEMDKLVAQLEHLEITNRELITSNLSFKREVESYRQQYSELEDFKLQLAEKERELTEKEHVIAQWWTRKSEFERQQIEDAKQKSVERRQKVINAAPCIE